MGTWIWSLRQHPTWVVKFHIVPLMLVAILHCMQNQNTSHQMLVYYCTHQCRLMQPRMVGQRASLASFFNKHTAPWWKLVSKWWILEDGHQFFGTEIGATRFFFKLGLVITCYNSFFAIYKFSTWDNPRITNFSVGWSSQNPGWWSRKRQRKMSFQRCLEWKFLAAKNKALKWK